MCGSTDQQNQIEATQQSFYTTMTQNAATVFGQDSALFNNLVSAFEPIFAAGPNQEGYTGEVKAALNTEATTGVTQNYQAAEKAIRENNAGQSDEYIPSGQEAAIEAGVTTAAAGQESAEQLKIEQDSAALGRENWLAAAQGMLGAPGVMKPAADFAGEATNAGTAAANTANQIAQQNQSWMGAVGGMLGTAVGGWASGGFKMPGG